MIEQTELVVTKWEFIQPLNYNEAIDELNSFVTFEVMKKTAATKKGIACRFSCRFDFKDVTILDYVAENSYVIDFEELINQQDLHTMISNTYTLFKEKFDLRKLGTLLHNKTLKMIDVTKYDLDPVILLLK